MGKIKEENIIGTRQGIFDVLYECDFKSNDGHRMFHVKCSKCGWETNMQMHQIKYTKVCNHINVSGQYISDMAKLEWSNKRLYSIYRGIIQRCYNHNEKVTVGTVAKELNFVKSGLKNLCHLRYGH